MKILDGVLKARQILDDVLRENPWIVNTTFIVLLLLGFVLLPPGSIGRNPPFHRWGGLDVNDWLVRFAGNFLFSVLSVAAYVKGIGNRIIFILAFFSGVAGLLWGVEELMTFVARGTI